MLATVFSWRAKPARPQTLGEVWLLARVWGALTLARLLAPRLTLPRLVAWIAGRRPRSRCCNPRDLVVMKRAQIFADALMYHLRYLQDRKCVPRSLALFYFAVRRGLPVRFHCGVARGAAGRLEGHAWISLHGEPYLEFADPRLKYVETFAYPPAQDKPLTSQQEPPGA